MQFTENNMHPQTGKGILVPKVPACIQDAKDIPALLDKENIQEIPIACVNWPEDFPYRPEVSFRIAHTGDAILLHFKVTEACVRAVAGEDNGPVWKDACVEFFLSPEGNDVYYNIESNCVGNILLHHGKKGEKRPAAPQQTIDRIQRWSSLGREPIEYRTGEDGTLSWEYAERIPKEVFAESGIDTFDGKVMTANFYKCGDDLPTPHYLSWKPITLEKPQFHCPEFFGKLQFQ